MPFRLTAVAVSLSLAANVDVSVLDLRAGVR